MQSLETELTSHEAALMGVVSRGKELVTAGHTASETITKKGVELEEAWSSLSTAADSRAQLLNDSLALQQVIFYTCIHKLIETYYPLYIFFSSDSLAVSVFFVDFLTLFCTCSCCSTILELMKLSHGSTIVFQW